MKIAFLGLGVMGFPMAGHIVSAQHQLTVYNRSPQKTQKFLDQFPKASAAHSPKDAAENADFVFACVGNDDDLRSITLGERGAFSSIKPSSVFVDHTTASAEVAQELYQNAQKSHFHFIDAPVSGGEAGAQKGKLTVMCGGDQKPFQDALPVIKTYAQKCILIGPSGHGQLTKMVNQICIAGLVQALSEALNFGTQAELNMDAVIDVISGGAAQSWQLDNRAHSMLNNHFNHGFAVEWMRKDLGICLQTAKKINTSLPITALVDQYYAQIIQKGGKRWDTSSLIQLLKSS
jgi:3-hydroxyisobutyrate dehydrogenase-like beta-hydroxyacid dehydrogenase